LREKLFGQGQALLSDTHPGASYRRLGQSLGAAE
jgi:long-chain alkane monooxygenase